MGESFGSYRIGDDDKIIAFITSANIACGYHAGDPQVMAKTVALARQHQVSIGAHPGYPDLMGYGRRHLETFPGEISNYVLYQIGALSAFARAVGVALQHVKPHGALYNVAARDAGVARAIARAVVAVDPALALVGLAGSQLIAAGQAAGLAVLNEAFADRRYQPSGRLVSRETAGALIVDTAAAAAQARVLAEGRAVATLGGGAVRVRADTICLHSDTPGALNIARAVHAALNHG